mmetsp:Transcript_36543/g.40802  ORF Transcript_36543/g.40802 Transcript_36543/m.40802 type:complete len:276 (+) Transcript_36543:78-905(+)
MRTTLFHILCLTLIVLVTQVSSFSSPPPIITGNVVGNGIVLFSLSASKTNNYDNEDPHRQQSATRAGFLKTSSLMVSVAVVSLSVLLVPSDPAFARGRATLEQAYERYSKRILDGGSFYKKDLKTLIAKDDWSGIKNAIVEPPQKTREDRVKIDGGIAERAAMAGQFSDSRVLVALDLLAAQFSDNSVSSKTKAMKKEVEQLRSVVNEMGSISRQALGEESSGGGFLGIGKKQTNKSVLSKRTKELYTIGGNSWNKYVNLANEGLPTSLPKLPYL